MDIIAPGGEKVSDGIQDSGLGVVIPEKIADRNRYVREQVVPFAFRHLLRINAPALRIFGEKPDFAIFTFKKVDEVLGFVPKPSPAHPRFQRHPDNFFH